MELGTVRPATPLWSPNAARELSIIEHIAAAATAILGGRMRRSGIGNGRTVSPFTVGKSRTSRLTEKSIAQTSKRRPAYTLKSSIRA